MHTSNDCAARSAAYGEVFESCAPLNLTAGASCLRGDRDIRGTVRQPDIALATLRRSFPESLLREAGIVTRRGDPVEERLSSYLTDPKGVVVALRENEGQPPFDLLTGGACLSGTLPALAILRDSTTRRLMKGRQLFATSSVEELVYLRSLGFAATLTIGLECMRDVHELHAVASIYGDGQFEHHILPAEVIRPSASRADLPKDLPDDGALSKDNVPTRYRWLGRSHPPMLVLLGWKLLAGSLELPATLLDIARYLREIHRHLGPDFHNIRVWRPHPNRFGKITLCRKFANQQMLRAAIERIVHDDIYEVTQFAEPDSTAAIDPLPEPTDFSSAQARLLQVLQEPPKEEWTHPLTPDPVSKARADFKKFIMKDLIDPLQRSAMTRTEPGLRNGEMVLADLARLLHELGPELHMDMLAEKAARQETTEASSARAQRLDQHLRIVAQFASLAQQVNRWESSF